MDVMDKKVQKQAAPIRFTLMLKTVILKWVMFVLYGTWDFVSSAIRQEANVRSSRVKMEVVAGESGNIRYEITPWIIKRSPSKK